MAFLDNNGVTTLVTRLKNYFALKEDKQDKLVSGTNIKTINNESLLGSGNISIDDGSSGLVLNISRAQGRTTTTYTLDKTVSDIVGALNSGISPVFLEISNDGSKNYYQLKSVALTPFTWNIRISCTGYADEFKATGSSAYPSFTQSSGSSND